MFADRISAGRELARQLRSRIVEEPIVLALPRGGVPIGFAIAAELHAPLDVLMVRKLAVPAQPELAFGAVGEFGTCVVDEGMQDRLGVDSLQLGELIAQAHQEIQRRVDTYRDGNPMRSVTGRSVIVADDGSATGSTALAAAKTLRSMSAGHITVALPTASAEAIARLAEFADDVVCLEIPEVFQYVGAQYEDFHQISDSEVRRWLREHDIEAKEDEPLRSTQVDIPLPAGVHLAGQLRVPHDPKALVVFAHGTGSSRFSVRNQYVARRLERAGFATLLFDLLTEDEAENPAMVFNVELLGERLRLAKRWARARREVRDLPVCYFGASTGAAAAIAAAVGDDEISSIVSRGGRPDLAEEYLDQVEAPTLLIVGERDSLVMELNEAAKAHMHGEVVIDEIPGATHLFSEPGALEEVTRDVVSWFTAHLPEDEPLGVTSN